MSSNLTPHRVAVACILTMGVPALGLAAPTRATPTVTPSRVVTEEARNLPEGRYQGYFTLSGPSEKIAVTLDVHPRLTGGATAAPAWNALLKFQLGGFDTEEYFTERFENVAYDADNDVLTLDEPESDVVVNAAKIRREGRVTIDGEVWFRSAGAAGKLHLERVTVDDQQVGFAPPSRDATFMPRLAGDYQGVCHGRKASLRIQIVKGMGTRDAGIKGLESYDVTAQLGEIDPALCQLPDIREDVIPYCLVRDYPNVTYSPFARRLVMEGPTHSDDCAWRLGDMTCRLTLGTHVEMCTLRRVARVMGDPHWHRRAFTLAPSADQARELPALTADDQGALAAAITGRFSGYLHQEARDMYQPVRLDVATSFGPRDGEGRKPVMVSASVTSFLGRGMAGQGWTQNFARVAFDPRPGLYLGSNAADAYLVVDRWQAGRVLATWYSRSYGRVGTLELLKGDVPPALPAAMKAVEPLGRQFAGPVDPGKSHDGLWRFNLGIGVMSTVVTLVGTLPFSGHGIMKDGLGVAQKISQGRYDPYTGHIGWAVEDKDDKKRMVSGFVVDRQWLYLYWPSKSFVGARMQPFGFYPYRPLASAGQ